MLTEILHLDETIISFLNNKKAICLVDGEHYPPVIKGAVKSLEEKDIEIEALFFLGGTEKIEDIEGELSDITENCELVMNPDQSDFKKLEEAIINHNAEIIIDLSDEPVVDYQSRFRIASITLKNGLTYLGADFFFTPPQAKDVLTKPSISIIGTGKRIGKTAMGVTISRILKKNDFEPVVVCMGRGGPAEPEIVNADEMNINADSLIKVAEQGHHAASDYWEDALLGQIKTVGCRRCGGGMAGNPFYSNVIQGAKIANQLDKKFIIMEGSGSTFPPIATNKTITLSGGSQPLWKIFDYFGRYRIMLADLVIVTMCEKPMADKNKVEAIKKGIREINPDAELALTVFRSEPMGNISGKRVFIATAAKADTKDLIVAPLENNYDCEIVGYTNSLSNREKLRKELDAGLTNADVLLTEIKAASIDTAARKAKEMGVEIIFMHNRAQVIGGTVDSLEAPILSVCNQAIELMDSNSR
ncbi:MAG: cyclic 2,3-diphosphoglycerate synthetase [Candidatus Marinimicrobia bacterium]|nr:cyclic 2,3-diphosphoglycerate synthetase [Candidatus Neomarinimicrobiota bacterium]